MSTENTLDTSAPGGTSTETTSTSVSTPSVASETKFATSNTSTLSPTGTDTTPVVPTYTPNFKYKAAFQEKELDAFWHPLIKDADSEKKVKDIFTRVDAFDFMKDKLTKRDQDYESLNQDYTTQASLVSKVMDAKNKGDLSSVFRNIGLTPDSIIRWAAKEVDRLQTMNNLPPEQRAAIEQQEQAALQNETYQEQLAQMQTQLHTQAAQARVVELEMSLLKPEVAPVVAFIDQKAGNGAFFDMVVEEGQRASYFEGKDLTVAEGIQRVIQKFGKLVDLPNQQSQAVGIPPTTTPAGTQFQAKPVIPVINGSSKAPIKKQFKSLDEIKKHAKELDALERSTL